MVEKTLNNIARAGKWLKQQGGAEPFSCFIPNPLPPTPPIRYDTELQDMEERANRALGRLEGISAFKSAKGSVCSIPILEKKLSSHPRLREPNPHCQTSYCLKIKKPRVFPYQMCRRYQTMSRLCSTG